MTTPQPAALPELPETDYRLGFCDEGGDQLLGLSGYTADQMDARYLRGYNDALAALQSQPAAAVVSDEPDLASKVVNDSCWKFVEAMPHQLPGPIWNDLKPALYAALMHYHRAILALRPQSEPVGFINKPIVWGVRQSEMIVKITSKAQPAYGFTHPIYAESPRPQAVPTLDLEAACIGYARLDGNEYKLASMRRNPVMDDGQLHPIYTFSDEVAEAHHGITAQGAQGEQA